MLFDTSSPGRKRVVQVIFASLAILMGGGLVFFGIGSSQQGGGLTDIVGNGGTDLADQGRKDAESAEKALEKNPNDIAAAEKLARARFAVATNDAFDPKTGRIKEDGGQALIDAADAAWTNYLKLAPEKPGRAVSASYATFYTYPGVDKYDKAARALETNISTREPSAGLYAQLAIYWLFGGSTDNYTEARKRALALAESDARKTAITKQLDDYKKQYDDAIAAQAKQAEQQQDASGEGGAGTTPKLPTLPTLTQ